MALVSGATGCVTGHWESSQSCGRKEVEKDNQFSVMKIRDSRGDAGKASWLVPVGLLYA